MIRLLGLACNFLAKLFIVTILSILFIASLFYLPTSFFDFPDTKPFLGHYIYNPYQSHADNLFRANFHAHSKAWKGITDGNDTEQELFDAYTQHGYDIASISNYHSISKYAQSRTDLYIPAYEHGYNILKSHYLVINAEDVSYFDFPLFQTTSHQQKVIHQIQKKNKYIAIAHPRFGGGRTFENMHHLVGYDFTEVLNHYRVSDDFWDEGLSAGKLSWVLGNDDIHNVTTDPSFKMWNMIYSANRHPDSIMINMKRGCHYAVQSYNGKSDNTFLSCNKINDSTFYLKFLNAADSIQWIGQGGLVKKTIIQSDSSTYTFVPADTYIRAVAFNGNSRILLNPLLRYDGHIVPFASTLKASENTVKTWSARTVIALLSLSFLFLIRKTIYF